MLKNTDKGAPAAPPDLKRIANQLAQWIYQHLISTTQIDRAEAFRIAVSAANKAAQSIECDTKRRDA